MTHTTDGIVLLRKTLQRQTKIVLLTILLVITASAEEQLRDPKWDKKIINSVVSQYKDECAHISNVDGNTLRDIQDEYSSSSSQLTKSQKECYDMYLADLRGIYTIYQQTCSEVSNSSMSQEDENLSRLFVNIRTYLTKFQVTQKSLNSCLIRSGVPDSHIVDLSDYSVGSKKVFKKIRQMEMIEPFHEERVYFR